MVDRYTKGVLTIIAICLAIIACRQLQPIHQAEAQNGQVQNGQVQNGQVQNGPVQNGPVHVIVDSAANYAFQFAGPLQVTVRGQ
jgi:hypothetical protein